MLPWWVGLILAVLTYWPLHHYASAEVPASAAPGQLGQLVTGQFIKTLASVGQYLIPGALAVGAAASFLGRRKRAALVTDLGGDPSGGTLRSMSWQDFELLVADAADGDLHAVVQHLIREFRAGPTLRDHLAEYA